MFFLLSKKKKIDALELVLSDIYHRWHNEINAFPVAEIKIATNVYCHFSITDDFGIQADLHDINEKELDGGGEVVGLFDAYARHRRTGKPSKENIRRRISFLADIITSEI
jgi:hypothetical protein